jgi:ABC-2 type transport system ATP-binding protein
MASGAVRRSWKITRADISMTTFVDTDCISIEYTDYSLQRPLALNFQFSPNFSIKIGLEASGNPPGGVPVWRSALIEVQDLTKSYGAVTAVDHVSFTVNKGEILGFLGPNGAGKTTTMRILTGYMPATHGTARVAGFDVFRDSMEVRRRIGYLPETPPVYPDMTVETYLDFVARIKNVPAERRPSRIDDALRKTNLEDRRSELIKRLSRGYKQRVGIAQALVHDPEVIILDEPTVGLDPKQIIEVRNLIKGLAGNHTIILSTHILPEVSMTCDRVVIINKGKIAAVDTPQNLTSQLKGGQKIRIETDAPEKSLRDMLAQIPGASRVVIEPARAGGHQGVTVEAAQGNDIRNQIAAKIVEQGWPLYELHGVSLSLEDIFLELTTDDAAHAQASS